MAALLLTKISRSGYRVGSLRFQLLQPSVFTQRKSLKTAQDVAYKLTRLRKADPSNQIFVHENVWEKFGNYNGHFQYYIFQRGTIPLLIYHRALCVRKSESDDEHALKIDLVAYYLPEKKNAYWKIVIKPTKWTPERRVLFTNVYNSTQTWHAAKVLKVYSEYSHKFGVYELGFKNCITFTNEFPAYMYTFKETSPIPIVKDFNDLQHYASNLGLKIQKFGD